jgi:hypothetical protein
MSVLPRFVVCFLVCCPGVVALGCGGTSETGFGSGSHDGIATAPDDAGSASNDGSGGAPNDDSGPTGVFTGSDASSLVFACQPGTYKGQYTAEVGHMRDAGALLSLLSIKWSGNLSITLQGQATTTIAGEIPETTLTIAPGAKLAGMDSNGGNFNADLTGQLDCPSKTLTATIANGSYTLIADAGVPMGGTLSATYDGTMTPPALTNGTMNLTTTSKLFSGVGATGTWTAALQ